MNAITEEWIDFSKGSEPIIDVRSPAEFQQGHIPSAINLPLLSNEERVIVGTLYKQTSPQAALIEGLRLASPKFADFVSTVTKLTDKSIRVYCWRGGMRSAFMGSLFSLARLNTRVLHGGYKSYRNWAINFLATPFQIKVLGGYTGSGKTEILKELKEQGEQVLDLENLAAHKGSSYGHIGEEHPQPRNEHLENLIAYKLYTLDKNRTIWVEDESRCIGRCKIPDALYDQLRASPLYIMDIPKEERIARLQKDYAPFGYASLKEPTINLEKRLGHMRTEEALKCIEQSDPYFFSLLLEYYDKAYKRMIERRQEGSCFQVPSPFTIKKLLDVAQTSLV